jgi:hypothetical protein
MAPVWSWIRGQLDGLDQQQFLNLFGYTGVGSLALAAKGANVVHVDASKKSVAQARDNAALSGLADAPIRWIVDDCSKFVAREVRRGRRYDAILLDPPKFGRGPEGETWRLEEDLPGLIANCAQLLDANSRCLFLTVYAVRMSALALRELLSLYAALGEPAVSRHAASLLRAHLQPITRRFHGAGPLTYGRGVGVTLELDEGLFAGSSAYVFGAVMQRFLARHVGMNSFTETRVQSAQRGEIAAWSPQIGLRPVA